MPPAILPSSPVPMSRTSPVAAKHPPPPATLLPAAGSPDPRPNRSPSGILGAPANSVSSPRSRRSTVVCRGNEPGHSRRAFAYSSCPATNSLLPFRHFPGGGPWGADMLRNRKRLQRFVAAAPSYRELRYPCRPRAQACMAVRITPAVRLIQASQLNARARSVPFPTSRLLRSPSVNT